MDGGTRWETFSRSPRLRLSVMASDYAHQITCNHMRVYDSYPGKELMFLLVPFLEVTVIYGLFVGLMLMTNEQADVA
jgi:tetrahydromethanopterin S-methyltransferase subunit B